MTECLPGARSPWESTTGLQPKKEFVETKLSLLLFITCRLKEFCFEARAHKNGQLE